MTDKMKDIILVNKTLFISMMNKVLDTIYDAIEKGDTSGESSIPLY